MIRKNSSLIVMVLILVIFVGSSYGQDRARAQANPTSGINSKFTYQGELNKNNSPYTGACDFTFSLWDSQSGNNGFGTEQKTGVAVNGGIFTVQLNEDGQFGASAFDGSQRWLGISVQCPGDSSATSLGRQELTAAPYASYALTAGSATNGVVTTGSYANPGWLTSLSTDKLTGIVPIANGGTGSSTQNFVDLSSSQSVGGVKTFTAAPVFNPGGNLLNHPAPFSVGSYNSGVVTNRNADMLDGLHASALQTRVNGACSAGSTVKAVNADGSVTCEPRVLPNRLAAPQGNAGVTLSVSGVSVIGQFTSMAIGADRLPVIAHSGSNGLDLTHCIDIYCQTPTTMLLDNAGSDPSLAIGADGLPVIAYYASQHDYVIHCSDAACSASSKNSISGSTIVQAPSITIGADGLPVIAIGTSGNDLDVVHCSDAACASATTNTVDAYYNGSSAQHYAGFFPSIAIGADGLPVIFSYAWGNAYTCGIGCAWTIYYEILFVHCSDFACGSSSITSFYHEPAAIGGTTLTIGVDGLPAASYFTASTVKAVHCSAQDCSGSSSFTTLDSAGQAPAITIGTDGLPVISYYDSTDHTLKVAHCSKVDCSTFTALTVDSNSDSGQYSSIAVGADTLPIISYFSVTNEKLKVLHCASTFCTPDFRWK